MLQNKKQNKDESPLYQCLGGTSSEKLAQQGRSRADGQSLSRTAQLVPGRASDFLFAASSGPGETNDKGLIVPRFGKNPENHVAVSMTFETLSELLLITKTHYEAWLSAWYAGKQNYCNNGSAARAEHNKTIGNIEPSVSKGPTAMF